jgi:hypothetical protein
MNYDYLYTMERAYRSRARALLDQADEALHDTRLSVRVREAMAANYRTQASLVYDQADAINAEVKRHWRGEAA